MSNTILTKRIGTTTYKVNVFLVKTQKKQWKKNFYG